MRRTEPDSIGFLERDAPLIFTSQYLVLEGRRGRGSADGIHRGGARRALGRADGPKRGWQITNSETRTFRVPGAGGSARVSTHWLVKSAPATSAVLTSAMVCVSESDIALKRVPAPSAVRFGAGSKQSISGTRRKSAGFLLVVETGAVQFRAKLGDVPEIQGASTSPWQPSPGMPWGSILARCASATACRPRRARHRVQSAKHPWTMTNPTSSSRGASLQPARMAVATMRRV